jgi:hypothetical protein
MTVTGTAKSVATSRVVQGKPGNYGPLLIALAGGTTLFNEWFQQGTNKVNWAIIPWTVFGMVGFSLLGEVSPFLANALGATVLLTELSMPFNGRQAPVGYLLSQLPKGK